MSITKHPAYEREKERLEFTVKTVEETIERIETNKEKYKGAIKQAMIDLDYLDSSLSYSTILTTSELLRVDRETHDKLLRGRKKPYFARIDFQEEQGSKKKHYIGKMTLRRTDTEDPLIIDWRSPIANVYYEGKLGRVSYESNQQTVSGELLLKRQYTIEDGELLDFMDIDITANDAFLQASLSVHADNRLRDIAATIQGEQNRVIRANINGPLIVQGVAGSGKTTIALHRVAYLIYTYQERFIPEEFLIIAPNNLFIRYISEVLPELGVERITQTTFEDYIFQLIGHKYKLINPNEKLLVLLEKGQGKKERDLLKKAAAYKGSMAFKTVIDRYVKDLEEKVLPPGNLELGRHVICDFTEIRELFEKEFHFLPVFKRFDQLKKVLNQKVKIRQARILEKAEEEYNRGIEKFRRRLGEFSDAEEFRLQLSGLMDERDKKLKSLKTQGKKVVKEYIKQISRLDLLTYYSELLTAELLQKYSSSSQPVEQDLVEYLAKRSRQVLEKKRIEYEDLAPLAYLHWKLWGFSEKPKISHVVIDEAQDLSSFQFYALKSMLNTDQFTILGDIAQGIHAYRGTTDWQRVISEVFPESESAYLTLKQSYRSTVEIMNLANKVIAKLKGAKGIPAQPVLRHGAEPEVRVFGAPRELVECVKQKAASLRKQKFKSLAVIGKTFDECRKIKQRLHQCAVEAPILTGEEHSYDSGLVIVPSYVAKGLEFDVVFIVNLHKEYQEENIDLTLLYVAMTRALHQLYVYALAANPIIS